MKTTICALISLFAVLGFGATSFASPQILTEVIHCGGNIGVKTLSKDYTLNYNPADPLKSQVVLGSTGDKRAIVLSIIPDSLYAAKAGDVMLSLDVYDADRSMYNVQGDSAVSVMYRPNSPMMTQPYWESNFLVHCKIK